MALGPGKYDDLATHVREETDARLVIIAVIGGHQGGGFSVQTLDPKMMLMLPEMLRNMADMIERDVSSVP
jgi:hypothetical protein